MQKVIDYNFVLEGRVASCCSASFAGSRRFLVEGKASDRQLGRRQRRRQWALRSETSQDLRPSSKRGAFGFCDLAFEVTASRSNHRQAR
jgi:hypothetical protein